jgi:hypothetical protein
MNREEVAKLIDDKRKGKSVSPADQANMIDACIGIGNEILAMEKQVKEDRDLIARLKLYFPLLHKEIRRIFLAQLKKPEV